VTAPSAGATPWTRRCFGCEGRSQRCATSRRHDWGTFWAGHDNRL
jgi:phosphoribosyl-dephospho-CoA transferase